jgi:signal transduction histidine kinase
MLPLAHVDSNQLELALLNLAVNGRDAMPTGGCLIIAAREESVASRHGAGLRAGRYVCISVTDRGEGMDEATLARAVEPFFTTKEVGKGTGLGLPMVHGMAEQSGGRLILKSQKGAGTTAELWLPVASQAADAERRHQLAKHDSKTDGCRFVAGRCG